MPFSAFDATPDAVRDSPNWVEWHPAYSGELEDDDKKIGRILNANDSSAVGFSWGKVVAGQSAGPLPASIVNVFDWRLSLQVTRGYALDAPVIFDQTIRVKGKVDQTAPNPIATGVFTWDESAGRIKTRICDGQKVARVMEPFGDKVFEKTLVGQPDPPHFRHESQRTIEVLMPELPSGAASLALWATPSETTPFALIQDGLRPGQVVSVDFVAAGGRAGQSESVWFRVEGRGGRSDEARFSFPVRDSFAEWEGNVQLRGTKGYEYCIGRNGFQGKPSPSIEELAFGVDTFDSQPIPLDIKADFAVGDGIGYRCNIDEESVFTVKRDDVVGRGVNRIKFRFTYLKGQGHSSLAVNGLTGESWFLYQGAGGVRVNRAKNGWGHDRYFAARTLPLSKVSSSGAAPFVGPQTPTAPEFDGNGAPLSPQSKTARLALPETANDLLLFGDASGSGETRVAPHFTRAPAQWQTVVPFGARNATKGRRGDDCFGLLAGWAYASDDALGGTWYLRSANKITAPTSASIKDSTFFQSVLLSPHFSFVLHALNPQSGSVTLVGKALAAALSIPFPAWDALNDDERNRVSLYTLGKPYSASNAVASGLPTLEGGALEANGFLKRAALPARVIAFEESQSADERIKTGDAVIAVLMPDGGGGYALSELHRAHLLEGATRLPFTPKREDALVAYGETLSLYVNSAEGLTVLRSNDKGRTFV